MSQPQPCPTCDQPHVTRHGAQACTAHRKWDGAFCTQPPIPGGTVCRYHGGATKAARAKAAQNVAESEARAVAHRFSVPVDTTPTEALLDEVRWTAGHVRFFRQQVQALIGDEELLNRERHPLVWGVTKEQEKEATKHPGTDVTEEARVSIWWTLYCQERDRLAAVSTAAVRAGVEERRVRLAEQQGDVIVEAIRAILADLRLSPEQQVLVGTVVPQHLRLLAGGVQ